MARRPACSAVARVPLAVLAITALFLLGKYAPPWQVLCGWRLHRLLTRPPLAGTCRDLRHFGGHSVLEGGHVLDGGWQICTDGWSQGSSRSRFAFSVGIGGDFSFDLALASNGFTVHSFDPSERKLCHRDRGDGSAGVQISRGVKFHCLGLADRAAGRQGRRMGGGQLDHWEMRTLAQLMDAYLPPGAQLGVLKVDCEGCEWEVLASLLFQPHAGAVRDHGQSGEKNPSNSGIVDDHVDADLSRFSRAAIPPGQSPLDRVERLAIEVHLWPPQRHQPDSWARHSAALSTAWHRTLVALETRGWRRVDTPRSNPQSTVERIGWVGDEMACCWELSYVNTRLAP